MSKHPVVVYGASGYTGRLICEYLREYGIPFIAAGRDAGRVQDAMDHNVPGIETATYEVVQVEHDVAALTELFRGAKVVCNTVGPFATYGGEVVEAALAAGCHYLDTTGEQNWMIDCKERFGAAAEEAGLVVAPCVAQMYTTGEIAAEIALETPGLDTLDMLVLWKGFPTTASTASIFTILMADHFYLEGNEYVQWPAAQGYDVVVPGQHATGLALPWGGTASPVWFKDDPRVANCKVLGGVFDRALMEGVVQMSQMVETDIKPLPPEQQREKLTEVASGVQSGMPPRENPRLNRSIDSVFASGPYGTKHVILRGNCNYKQTGVLQAYGARHLLTGKPLRTGFVSGCQAFGHRTLLAELQSFGLIGEPEIASS